MSIKVSRRDVLVMGLAGAAAGLLAGCSSGGASGGTPVVSGKTAGMMKDYAAGTQFKASKPLKVTMLFQDNPAYPYKKTWKIFSQIKKDTNVTLQPTVVPFADYSTKMSVLINSGNAPDIIAKSYPGTETQFVGGGAILPVSEYTKYMPNFTKKVKEWNLDADLDSIRQGDGKFYVLPGLHQTLNPDYTLSWRDDVLEELGLEAPDTWDKVKTTLQAIKDAKGVTPWTERYGVASAMNIAAVTYGTMAGYDAATSGSWGLGTGLRFDFDKKKFSYTPADENYKALIAYFADLVKNGLLDPDSFTMTDDKAGAKFTTGKTFVISTNSQQLQLDRTALDKSLGAGKYKISKGPIPGGPNGKIIAGSRLENGIMLSTSASKKDDFEAFLQFVDWQWYSDEAQVMAKWGIKGETYVIKDGKYEPAPGWKLAAYGLGDPNAKKDIRNDDGFGCGNFVYGGTTQIVESTMADEELAWQKTVANYKLAKTPPSVPYTPVEAQQAAQKQTALIGSTTTWTMNFILGKKDLSSDWDAYVNELKAKGMQEYVDNANKAYDAAQKKK